MLQSPANKPDRARHRAALAILAGAGALCALAGCTSSLGGSDSPTAGTSSTPSMTQRFSQLFSSGSTATGASPAPSSQQNLTCPAVDVRQGASTYSLNAPGADSNALALRYQAVIGDTARECAGLGATMTIKLGVRGRIILGPAGVPGNIDIPMRFAVVREGPEPKTVWTKFYRIPVTIPQGQANTPFAHVEEDLTFPMPSPADLDSYVVYVGFDPQGMMKQPPAPKRR